MRSAPLLLLLAACAADPGATAAGGPAARPEGADVLLLATRPRTGVTTLHRARTGALSAPLVTLAHHGEAVVRAAVHPGGAVWATVDVEAARDPSFAASLLRLSPGRGPERLAEDVVYASRPLVTADGRVFVTRGSAGAVGPAGRVDELHVDEIDETGASRTVLAAPGFALFLAGAAGGELVLYHVVPEAQGSGARASLLAVDPDTAAVRALAQIPPFARDFSIAEGDVVFQDLAPDGTFGVQRVSLRGGAPRAEGPGAGAPRLAPFAWEGVGLLRSDERGLLVRGEPRRAPGRAPDDVEQILDVSADGAAVAGLRHRPGRSASGQGPVPFVLRADGELLDLPSPDGARVAVAGFSRGGW